MSGEKDLSRLLASMEPVLLETEFVFTTLETIDNQRLLDLNPVGTFREVEGHTLIIEKRLAEQYQYTYSGVFKCITLNVHSSLDAVGLTAAVSTELAEQGISANVVAAYYHDHIFVPIGKAKSALNALKKLAAKNAK